MRNLYHAGLIWTLFAVLILSLSGCSDEGDNTVEPEAEVDEEIDFNEFSGKYLGSWSWESANGTLFGPISMEIDASANNEHLVKFYQTHKFIPEYNSDGITPEATGTTTITGNNQVTMELELKTDAPLCTGAFMGSGSLNSEGRLVLNMEIFEDCAESGPAVFSLVKVADI